MNRREVLELLIALPILSGCGSSYRSVTAREEGDVLHIDVAEFSDGSSLLVRSKKYKYPIYIFCDDTGAYHAFLAECTHKGCELQLEGSVLACPCHGSEFSTQGIILNGPATRNLQAFRISSDENNIRVYLS